MSSDSSGSPRVGGAPQQHPGRGPPRPVRVRPAQLRATAHVMDLLLEDIGKMDLTLGRVGLGFRASGRRVGVALRGHV